MPSGMDQDQAGFPGMVTADALSDPPGVIRLCRDIGLHCRHDPSGQKGGSLS